MVNKMVDLVLHHILGTVTATPRNACIPKCKQVLVHVQLVGDDGVQVGGNIKHVCDLDLVSTTLSVTLATQVNKTVSKFTLNVF